MFEQVPPSQRTRGLRVRITATFERDAEGPYRVRHVLTVQWRDRARRLMLAFPPWGERPNGPERLALVGVLLTPVTLFVDHRLGLGLSSNTVTYVPYDENAGQPVSYTEVLGWTQLLWVVLALVALTRRRLRRGFGSVPVAALSALVALIVGVTIALDGLDGFARHALLTTLVPLVAITGILFNPDVRLPAVRRLVFVLSAITATVVLGTLAVNALKGTLGERFDVYLFGSPTDTGLVLALLLILTPAVAETRWVRAGLAVVLAVGLVLSETRGGLLAAGAGALVTALLLPRLRLVTVGAIAVALVAFVIVSDRSLLSISDPSNSIRRESVERHWQLFLVQPSYGYGLSAEARPFVTAAHNVFLGLANAGGAAAALLWLVAWSQPLVAAVRDRARSLLAAVPAAVLVGAIVTWVTTGSEVLVFVPPTNLLPLVLAVALARAGWGRFGSARLA